MSFKDYLKENKINVWSFKNKKDMTKLANDGDNFSFGPMKTPEEAFNKVRNKSANWIVAQVGNQYWGIAGIALNPNNFGAKLN